jgi:general secretion pathway protein G
MVGTQSARPSLKEGFTLIEILVAIAIVAFMAGVAVPGFLKLLEGGKISAAKADIQGFKQALSIYQIKMGKYPDKLKDLIKASGDEQEKKRWKQAPGPFYGDEGETEIKPDPWGYPYKYKKTPGTSRPYELLSDGPNGPGSPKEEQISVWDK